MSKKPPPGGPKLPTWRTRFLGAATALVLVVAALSILIAVKGNPTPRDVAFVPAESRSPAPHPSAGSRHPAHRTSPSEAGHSPDATQAPAAPGTASAPAGTPSNTTPSPSPAAPVPLTVLNDSTVSGLATQTAAQFHAAGWPIAEIGNLQGETPVTTVYYAPGERAAAEELARQFPGIRDVEPRYAGLPGADLTVVLTGDYS